MSQSNRFTIDQGWQVLLKDLGISVNEVLKRSEMPGDLFTQRDVRLKPEEYFRLWNGLAATIKDTSFPLHLAEAMTADCFSAPMFAAYCSPNLNVALERLSHFKPLIGPMRLAVTKNRDCTRLDMEFTGVTQEIPVCLIAMELLFFVKLARMGTREHVIPLEAVVPAELPHADAYRDFLGVAPRKGRVISLTFAAADARLPFVTENETMWEFFEPSLRKKLSDATCEDVISQRIRSSLLELLPSGRASIDHVAMKLSVSKRTLQRQLKEENTTYRTVLNQVREELARYYLTHSNLPGTQISFLLGFDDPNSFVRAFRLWTGTTPERVRTDSLN